MFDLKPGTEIIVLGDIKKGLAILPKEKQSRFIEHIFKNSYDHEEEDNL